MHQHTTSRTAVTVFALALAGFLAGCAGGGSAAPDVNTDDASTGTSDNQSSETQSPGAPGAPGAQAEGDDEYAFGVGRDDMATAIETAFSTDNGKARWDGDTLVLSVDGDFDSPMAGFTECRVLSQLLLETDESAIEYPGGMVSCAEVLADD